MRHIFFLEGTRKVYDGQFRCPFVVIGQRDEAHFRPPKPERSAEPGEALQQAKAAWATHQRQLIAGRFALTTIEWCETREEAESVAVRFQAPEWVHVEISDQVKILEHSHP